MPFWIPTPTGPQYVDENGNPADPSMVPVSQQTDLTGGNAPAVPMGPGSTGGVMPSPEEEAALSQQAPLLPPPAAPSPTNGVSQAGGPPPSPGFVTPQLLPGQRGSSASYGESGFSPARHGQVLATQGRLGQAYQNASNQAAQGQKTESDAAAALTGDYARASLGTSQALAEQEKARAGEFREQARLASMFAAAESTAAGLAAERTSGYRARYEQSLQAAAAMSVQPGLQLSGWEGAGAVASLFAQGFLGAKGVPVGDVSGILSKMVDRNIQLQQDKIRRGERLAEGQRALWDMARSEASDDSEVRSRLRGFLTVQAAAQMEATTAQFGSKLALARGQEAAAAIRSDLNKQLGTISDRYFTQYMQQSHIALDQWKAEMTNSQESRRLGIAQQEANQKGAAQEAAAAPNVIFDTSKSGGGVAKWKFLRGVPPEKQHETREMVGDQAAFLDHLDEYHRLSAEAGKVPGGWGKAMTQDVFAKRAEAWRNGLAATYSRAMFGARASDKDMDVAKSRIPINNIFTKDGTAAVDRIIGDMESEVASRVNHAVGSVAIPTSAEERASLPRTSVKEFAPGESALGRIRGEAQGEKRTEVKDLLKAITSPTDESKAPVSDTWLHAHPDEARQVNYRQSNPLFANDTTGKSGFFMPTWAPDMERLHDLAADPWGSAGPTGQDAWTALTQLEDSADDAQQREYARQLKDDIVQQRDEANLPRYTVKDFLSE